MWIKNIWLPRSTEDFGMSAQLQSIFRKCFHKMTGDGKSWFEANQCSSIDSFCSHIHIMVTGRPESSLPKMLSRSFSLFVWIQTKGGFQVLGPLQVAPFKAKMQQLDMEVPLNCSTAVEETLFLLFVSTLEPEPKECDRRWGSKGRFMRVF